MSGRLENSYCLLSPVVLFPAGARHVYPEPRRAMPSFLCFCTLSSQRLSLQPFFLRTPAHAQERRDREANSVYAARRAKLAAQIDSPILLWGFTGREESAQTYIFAQEDNFYYLTGHNEEAAGLIILPAAAQAAPYGHDVGRSAGNAFSAAEKYRKGKMERFPHVAVRSRHSGAHRFRFGFAIPGNARHSRKARETLSNHLHHSSL